jgi:hypothetical protein
VKGTYRHLISWQSKEQLPKALLISFGRMIWRFVSPFENADEAELNQMRCLPVEKGHEILNESGLRS